MDPVNHGWAEELELYAFGRLAPERVVQLEEHLMVCSQCQQALDDTVVLSRLLKGEQGQLAEAASRGWLDWLRTPAFAMVAAALLLAAGIGWFANRRALPQTPLASIQLVALRGEMPIVEPSRQTELKLIDVGGFSGVAEVVDANGGAVWKGPAMRGQAVRIDRPLGSGTYFVRLYDGTRLVHEYGFRVR